MLRRITILGGSNSVLRVGLQSGLAEHAEIHNLSLGATCCMQNIYELVRSQAAIRLTDFIVAESNVNDIMQLAGTSIDMPTMLAYIDEYYRLLNNTKKPVVALILPTHPRQEPANVVATINTRHKLNCLKYGFPFVDFDPLIASLPKEHLDNLLLHPRHLHEPMMHNAGKEIAKYLLEHRNTLLVDAYTREIYDGPSYTHIAANELQGVLSERTNSNFSEQVVSITSPIELPESAYDKEIIAIAAWCENYSTIEVFNDSDKCIKTYSKHYNVAEIRNPIFVDATTRITVNKANDAPTEKTILAKHNPNNQVEPFLLAGLLLRQPRLAAYPDDIHREDPLDISKLVIPDWRPYGMGLRSFALAFKTNNQ